MRALSMRQLLDPQRVGQAQVEEQTYYSALDIVTELTDARDAAEAWAELKEFEPALTSKLLRHEASVSAERQDLLPLSGVLILIQEIDSPKAARLRAWMAGAVAERLAEEENPELAVQRLRQRYEAKGRDRRWIDQRLNAISARDALVGEWYLRGVRDSEQFRLLTNRLMEAAFGMDVTAYRQAKGIDGNLRDHLSDLELALVGLAETTAASLHRRRQSKGVKALLRDVHDAGQIIDRARREISNVMTDAGVAA